MVDIIETTDLTKTFDSLVAVEELRLSVKKGEALGRYSQCRQILSLKRPLDEESTHYDDADKVSPLCHRLRWSVILSRNRAVIVIYFLKPPSLFIQVVN